jgi:hypothetical protein
VTRVEEPRSPRRRRPSPSALRTKTLARQSAPVGRNYSGRDFGAGHSIFRATGLSRAAGLADILRQCFAERPDRSRDTVSIGDHAVEGRFDPGAIRVGNVEGR